MSKVTLSLLLFVLLGVGLYVMSEQEAEQTPRNPLSYASLPRDDSFLQGVALGLYYKLDEEQDYELPLAEIAALGADTVSFVVTWSQDSVDDLTISPDARETRPDAVVEEAIRVAHANGLRVLLFPIVRVNSRAPGDWRGVLRPPDVAAWFESYGEFIGHYADLAQRSGAAIFSVGSELGSMEQHEDRWRAVIRDVRERYEGPLMYSANWDHYRETPFWDAVDLVGLTAYYELADGSNDPISVAGLTERWKPIRSAITDFMRERQLSFVFTEVGYYSQIGAAWHPWDYTRDDPVELTQQEICYQAFYEAWKDVPELSGVFFWHWFGEGGPEDNSYSPRGKPAETVISFWYGQ
jgi:hypothetical protein